jgi:hypothetical protein
VPIAPVKAVGSIDVLAEEAELERQPSESRKRPLAELAAARANGGINEEDVNRLETQLIERTRARHGLQTGP